MRIKDKMHERLSGRIQELMIEIDDDKSERMLLKIDSRQMPYLTNKIKMSTERLRYNKDLYKTVYGREY